MPKSGPHWESCSNCLPIVKRDFEWVNLAKWARLRDETSLSWEEFSFRQKTACLNIKLRRLRPSERWAAVDARGLQFEHPWRCTRQRGYIQARSAQCVLLARWTRSRRRLLGRNVASSARALLPTNWKGLWARKRWNINHIRHLSTFIRLASLRQALACAKWRNKEACEIV